VTAVGRARPQVIEDDEQQRVSGRVAAVEVAKATGMACVRLPRRDGSRYSKVREVTATMGAVTELGRQLMADRIEMVTLEAASDYWRIFYYVLEMRGLAVQLVSPSQAKNLKGRPGTGKPGSMRLARLTEWGMLRPCFVPPAPIRALRDYTRARTDLVRERTRCWQRLEKLLEGALIKLSSVASKLTTQSAQDMITAMIAGERDPRVLADMAQTRMRAKHDALVEALTGMFDSRHGELAQLELDQIAFLNERIGKLQAGIRDTLTAIPAAQGVNADGTTGPDAGHGPDAAVLPAVARLAEIPGVSGQPAAAIIAETGLDMTRFPTAAHLVSWAGLCRVASQPGPRSRGGTKGTRQRLPAQQPRPGRHRIRPHRHLPRRAVRTDRPPARHGQSPGRRRPVDPDHHLAPAQRPRRPLHRPRPGLRRQPHRPGQEDPQPRPRAPGDGTRSYLTPAA
jgi:transposase